MEIQDMSWYCLVLLFLASLLIVSVWLIQYLLNALYIWRARKTSQGRGETARHLPYMQAGGVWEFLRKLRPHRHGGSASEAGVKGLLGSLFSFKSFRENWQRAWVRALNEQACRHGSSVQITFDSSLQPTASAAIESVSCTDQSAHSMVLECRCCVDTVTFPVTVTQQSPAAVTTDTYQITLKPTVSKLVVSLEEVENEGLLVSWTLSKQPSFILTVSPRRLQRQGSDGEADLNMIKEMVEDTLFSAQPAMVLNLKTSLVPLERLQGGLNSQGATVQRLVLRQIRATCHKGQWSRQGELCCVLSLDQPATEKRTHFLCVPRSPSVSVEWSEDVALDLGSETRVLTVRLLERNSMKEEFLPGSASIALDLSRNAPSGQHTLCVMPSYGFSPSATVTLELLHVQVEEPRRSPSLLSLRSSNTPTKKVDVDRTVMPDGTIVTTVTTIQSRPKLDRNPGDSPLCSPSKVEVTEKRPTVLSGGSSPSPSARSSLSNGLDPVAETAIWQLTQSACRAATKTPTKRSTLIISGVTKVPLSEDESALSLSYAAAMDAAMHTNHQGTGGHHRGDPGETTPSDVSDRPSVDDVESDTGSTGALETRSLKDHKVGFLQSGTKLLFRRKRREKDTSFSQSHEDISNLGNNFAATPSSSRTKSGSFSRRLIKRFSFRSSGKSKGKATATNGGAGTLDN